MSALVHAASSAPSVETDSVSPTQPVTSSDHDAELRLGARFGRYVVLELLGIGGMGVVYAAQDPELNRRVALKVLRHRSGDGDRAPIRDTLLREGRAMAQLAHPNVVTVFDIGTVEDRVFIAMELVTGQTLASWLAAARRSHSEIIAVFLAAGQGLAAAHAAGLIHRDFKPDNVLIGQDGRVRVTDFGLALAAPREPLDLAQRSAIESRRGDGARASALAGTLAYMAPEQYLTQAADARADQFSFAVALHEALHGERPRAALRLPGKPVAPRRRRAAPPGARGEVPVALQRVLRRALRVDPRERYPSMAALLAALTPTPRRSRRVAVAAIAAVMLVIACAAGYAVHLQHAAAQRAQRMGRLRGLAVEMRTVLRSAHMLPQHDIRPARDQVRQRIRDAEDHRRATAGQDESALIEFVIGEGHRALGDHARALRSLEAAWAAGERGPQIEASLGHVLGTIYGNRADEIEIAVPVHRRAAELRAIEQRFRDPAMAHLRAAIVARAGSPAYLEALISFHERRFADASTLAHAALAEAPTFYEAGVLEAEAQQAAALELMIADRRSEALEMFARARQTAARVVEVARSDDDTWLAYGEILYMQALWIARDPEQRELREQAITALHKVAAINPERWEPWLREAHLYQQAANEDIIASRDPGAHVAKVLALAAQARARGAATDEVDVLVCLAHWARGVHHGNHGIDPHTELERASDACDRAVATRPDASKYASLAAVYTALAAYQASHGIDPMPAVRAGERNLRAALAIEDTALLHYHLARLWITVVHDRDGHGEDPDDAIDRVLTELEVTTRTDATRADAWATRAEALIVRARRWCAGCVEAAATLVEARAALERALEIAPQLVSPIRHRMALAERDAQARLERHADPSAAVARIRADAQHLLRRAPDNSVAHRMWSRAEVLAARWALVQRATVEPLLTRAAAQAARAREADPVDPLSWVTSAAVEQLRAEVARARGASPEAAIARARAFVDRALALDARHVGARRLRDELAR